MLDKLRQVQEEQFGRLHAIPDAYLNENGKAAIQTHLIILNAMDFSETVEDLIQSLNDYLKTGHYRHDFIIKWNLEQYIKKISK